MRRMMPSMPYVRDAGDDGFFGDERAFGSLRHFGGVATGEDGDARPLRKLLPVAKAA